MLWHELCFIYDRNLKFKSIHTVKQSHERKNASLKYPFRGIEYNQKKRINLL
jgi:hypothetical protein